MHKNFAPIFIIMIFISACGTVSASQPVPTASQMPTNTPMPIATQTETPTPTNTSIPTITPIPAVPDAASEFFRTIDWSDFVSVTHEERLGLNDKFMNDSSRWKLPADPASVVYPANLLPTVASDGTSVFLSCYFLKNCAPHYAVVEDTPEGLLYIVIWELVTKDPDGNHRRTSLSTAFVSGNDYKDWQLAQIRRIGEYGVGHLMAINLVINLKVSDPAATELARTLLGDDPLRLALTNGVIDEQTGDILFWTTIISTSPNTR